MNPTHKVAITDPSLIDVWFNVLAKAHRNPGGKVYELKLSVVSQQIPNLRTTRIRDCVFFISTLADKDSRNKRNMMYLTIIDREIYQQINSVRWIPKRDINYWSSGKSIPNQLHQAVVALHNNTVHRYNDIHHQNCFTFDNRFNNLVILTSSAHRAVHASIGPISPCEKISDNHDMIDFITTVV